MRRAVFLDRDGVLNEAIVRDGKPYPPGMPEEVVIPGGTLESLQRLRAAGFLLIVVTNQPDVARGTRTREDVEAINRVLEERLPLDEIRVCFHDDADRCECRKPKPGLLAGAAREQGIDLAASYMIGDRAKDVEAGRRAGTRTIFLDRGYREALPAHVDKRAVSLAEATDWILQCERSA